MMAEGYVCEENFENFDQGDKCTEEFDWCLISDVKCIVWNFKLHDSVSPVEKKRRKLLKDKVGKQNLDIVMLIQ